MIENKPLTAVDIMSTDVVTVHPDMALKNVALLMLRERVHGFPVVNQNQEVVGVVTTTDLLTALGERVVDVAFRNFAHLCNNLKMVVHEVMTKDVTVISEDTSIKEIIQLSVFKSIHSLPVIREGKMIGIVGKKDILSVGFSEK